MYRSRSSDGFDHLAAGSMAGGAVLAALVLAVIVIALVALITELGRIFTAHVHDREPRRILLSSLVAFLVLLLLSGLLASNPVTVPYSLPLVSWAFLALVVVWELTDRRYRKEQHAVPKTLSIADVVSFAPVAPRTPTHRENGREQSAVPAR